MQHGDHDNGQIETDRAGLRASELKNSEALGKLGIHWKLEPEPEAVHRGFEGSVA
jgi:hypothetical protein